MSLPRSPERAPGPSRRFLIAAVLGGLLIIVIPLVVILVDRDPRLAATNSRVLASRNTVAIEPGATRCQGGEYVPRSAAALRVFPRFGGIGGEPLELVIRDVPTRPVATVRVPGGYPAGNLVIALPPRPGDVQAGQLCLRNIGTRRAFFDGSLVTRYPEGAGVNTPYQRPGDEIRADYFRDGEQSWFAVAPVIARRFSLFKAPAFGTWTFWVVLAGILAMTCSACVLLIRALRP